MTRKKVSSKAHTRSRKVKAKTSNLRNLIKKSGRLRTKQQNASRTSKRQIPREDTNHSSSEAASTDGQTDRPRFRDPDTVTPPPPRVVIDHTAYPDIIDSIINLADLQTYVGFRLMNTEFRKKISSSLREIVIRQGSEGNLVITLLTGLLIYDSWAPPTDLRSHYHEGCKSRPISNEYKTLYRLADRIMFIKIIGKCDLSLLERVLSPLFDPYCDCTPWVQPCYLYIHPDRKGEVIQGLPSRFGGEAIFMQDNSRVVVEGDFTEMQPQRFHSDHFYSFDLDHWYDCHSEGPLPLKNIIFTITGSESSRLVATVPSEFCDQSVVYDFTQWMLPSHSIGGASGDISSDVCPNPRIQNLAAHAAACLQTTDSYVLFDGLECVDSDWLDPLYKSGKPWSLCPAGSKRDGHRMPFIEYIRNLILHFLKDTPESYERIKAAPTKYIQLIPRWDSWRERDDRWYQVYHEEGIDEREEYRIMTESPIWW